MPISLRQEVADAKTVALRNEAALAAVLTAVKSIPGVDGEALAAQVASAVSNIKATDVAQDVAGMLTLTANTEED